VALCARDPLSRERLVELTGRRSVDLGADIAFLLRPTESSNIAAALSWIDEQKAEGRILVGVNINPQVLASRMHLDRLLESYARAMQALLSEGASFILIPHDFRAEISDQSLSRQLLDMGSRSLRLRVFMMPSPCTAAEVKAVCAKVDVALVGRMHCAIACLGQGVPVGAISYQGKFAGLFGYFGIDDLVVAPDVSRLPSRLHRLSMAILDRRQEIRQQILVNLPTVKDLARVNVTCALRADSATVGPFTR
jgi:polysaccharide pyruvyl transferase WcaK-like protein